MSRYLLPSQAAAALRRGAQVEQLLSVGAGRVVYLTVSPCRDGVHAARRHEVEDVGDETFCDLSEFPPVDAAEDAGEGVVVERSDSPDGAVAAAARHGGTADRWLNEGTAADAYRSCVSERANPDV